MEKRAVKLGRGVGDLTLRMIKRPPCIPLSRLSMLILMVMCVTGCTQEAEYVQGYAENIPFIDPELKEVSAVCDRDHSVVAGEGVTIRNRGQYWEAVRKESE